MKEIKDPHETYSQHEDFRTQLRALTTVIVTVIIGLTTIALAIIFK